MLNVTWLPLLSGASGPCEIIRYQSERGMLENPTHKERSVIHLDLMKNVLGCAGSHSRMYPPESHDKNVSWTILPRPSSFFLLYLLNLHTDMPNFQCFSKIKSTRSNKRKMVNFDSLAMHDVRVASFFLDGRQKQGFQETLSCSFKDRVVGCRQ